MGQIFHPSSNTIAKATFFGGILVVLLAGTGLAEMYYSTYNTREEAPRSQPVPFSHKHHVTDDGIDCRYCHTGVETSSFAGIPSVEVCMGCHSYLWRDAQMLAPIRKAFRTGIPIQWNRVNDLPDYVFFNHSIHIKRGVACTHCHGPVPEMPLMWKAKPLTMQWCLACHRNPKPYAKNFKGKSAPTNCDTCHR